MFRCCPAPYGQASFLKERTSRMELRNHLPTELVDKIILMSRPQIYGVHTPPEFQHVFVDAKCGNLMSLPPARNQSRLLTSSNN